MKLPFGKPVGILYLERTGFKFFLSKKNISATLEFEKGTLENLEYVNQGKLDTQIAKFVSKYQLEPSSIVIVLSDSVIFSKKYKVKSLDQNTHAINDFLEELPFVADQIVYKSFGLGYEPGKAIAVATNINVYIGLVGSFSRLGWSIKAIVPEAAIGVVGVSVSSISQILKDRKMLSEADFLKSTPDNVLQRAAPDVKKSVHKKNSSVEVAAISSLAFDSPESTEKSEKTEIEVSEVSSISANHRSKRKTQRSPAFIPMVIVIGILIIGVGGYTLFKKNWENKKLAPPPAAGPAILPGPPQNDGEKKDDSEKATLKDIYSDTLPVPVIEDAPKLEEEEEESTVVYLNKEDISIQVLNGTGEAGLAGRTKDSIETLGYSNVDVGNGEEPYVDDTFIYYGDEVSPDNVNEIKNALNNSFSSIVSEMDSALSVYDILVITGKLAE